MATAAACAAFRPWFFHRLMAHCQPRAVLASVVPPASRSTPSTSSLSRMEKFSFRFRRVPSARSMRTPSEWKVLTTRSRAARGPTKALARSRISAAALLVKVMAAICLGSSPVCSSLAILCTMTRVLPEPAPASTRHGPFRWCTAWFWAGLSEAGAADMGGGS